MKNALIGPLERHDNTLKFWIEAYLIKTEMHSTEEVQVSACRSKGSHENWDRPKISGRARDFGLNNF
jgi:hypothetical protein